MDTTKIKASIKTWLTAHSSFMNDVQFLAFMAHAGWSGLSTLAALFLFGVWPAIILGMLWVAFASVKEFYYDTNFEIPRQTFADNLEDWIGYAAGLLVVVILAVVHARIV